MIGTSRSLQFAASETVIQHDEHSILRSYVMDRPGPAGAVAAVEIVLDVTLVFPRPVSVVWEATKDFNKWQNRYGYVWDGIPAESEGKYLYISNKVNDFGGKIQYLLRKVIAQQLIYIDSTPTKVDGMDVTWSGHNVFSYTGEGSRTTLGVFMEHTFFSSSLNVQQLRDIPRGMLESGQKFWQEFFIPDLQDLVRKA